jgi:hypothetical protein
MVAKHIGDMTFMGVYYKADIIFLFFRDSLSLRIAAFAESFASGTDGSILQMRACRLAYPANATIAGFRS